MLRRGALRWSARWCWQCCPESLLLGLTSSAAKVLALAPPSGYRLIHAVVELVHAVVELVHADVDAVHAVVDVDVLVPPPAAVLGGPF